MRHVRVKTLPIYRASPTPPASGDSCHGACSCRHPPATPPSSAAPPSQLAVGHTRSVVRIAQMDCPVEANMIEHALGKLPEVSALAFNLPARAHRRSCAGQRATPGRRRLSRWAYRRGGRRAGLRRRRPSAGWGWPLSGAAALGAELAHAFAPGHGCRPCWRWRRLPAVG